MRKYKTFLALYYIEDDTKHFTAKLIAKPVLLNSNYMKQVIFIVVIETFDSDLEI